jgi:hypothetical protein
MRFVSMVLGARPIAATLSVGRELNREQAQWLTQQPQIVQRAIKACRRRDSRYLPPGVGHAPPPLGSSPKELLEYRQKTLRDVVRAEEQGDPKALDKARRKSFDLPKNVPGFGRVINAIAVSAGCAPKTLYAWVEKHQRQIEQENRLNRQRQIEDRYRRQEGELQSQVRKEDLEKLRREKEIEDRYWAAHDAYRGKGNPAHRARAK